MSPRSRKHVVLEVDGERWSATLASLERRRFVVLHVHHHDPATDGPADAAGVLRWLSEQDALEWPVHLVVSDASVRRFDITLPSLGRAEMLAVIERQARGKLGVDSTQPVLVAHKPIGRSGGKRTDHAVLAVQIERRSDRTLAQALVANEDLNRASLCEVGDAVLLALPEGIPEHLALVDCTSQGLRFVYLQAGLARRERLVGTSGLDVADPAALAAALAMELPRTLDYMEEVGLPAPEAVAFAPALGLDADAKRQAAGGLAVVDVAVPDDVTPADVAAPRLGTIGFLRHLATGGGRMVELAFRTREPRSVLVPAAAALLALVSLAGVVGGVAWNHAADAGRAEAQQIEGTLEQRRAELDRLEEQRRVDARRLSTRVDAALSRRRPASRLLGEACNRAPEAVRLTEIVYTEEGDVLVAGFVRGLGRLEAIRTVEGYRMDLDGLPFVEGLAGTVRYDSARPAATAASPASTAAAGPMPGAGVPADPASTGTLTFRLAGRWSSGP